MCLQRATRRRREQGQLDNGTSTRLRQIGEDGINVAVGQGTELRLAAIEARVPPRDIPIAADGEGGRDGTDGTGRGQKLLRADSGIGRVGIGHAATDDGQAAVHEPVEWCCAAIVAQCAVRRHIGHLDRRTSISCHIPHPPCALPSDLY